MYVYARCFVHCYGLLLLIKCYSLCKVLACSMAFFQLSLSCATLFQLRTFILLISSKTSSSQRVLGHGFPSLNLLNIITLGHAFNIATVMVRNTYLKSWFAPQQNNKIAYITIMYTLLQSHVANSVIYWCHIYKWSYCTVVPVYHWASHH